MTHALKGPVSGIVSLALTLTAVGQLRAQRDEPYVGYTTSGTERQRTFEARLRGAVDTALLRAWSRTLSAQPHVAGTSRQRWTALFVDSLTRAWGLESRVDSYLVYLPHPISLGLERTSPPPAELIVTEPALAIDPATAGDVFPAFNAYTGRGVAAGEVVYVNHGLIEDYALLDSLGVSVAGKIVVARYGRSYRGIKAREAERHGAAGLVMYSDPVDDGYVRGDVYPEGPFRPERGVQRGSIKNGSGDPSTPAWASTFDARRVREEEMEGIARIPVLPVGYGTASELLRDLRGVDLPDQSWQGGLPFRYHVGPGPVTARLRVETERQTDAYHAAYNTVAIVPGSVHPEKWIVVGAHRDAWGPGAIDNVSGTVSVLAMARAFAGAARDAMRPARTLVFATWDAEEWGLIGSVEWVEHHAAMLSARVVAYVNQDAVASGPNFGASATGALKRLIRETTRDVPNPFAEGSLYSAWQGADAKAPSIGDLGGGSDFAGFYNHLGIPAANLGFGGAGGVYHSAYDSYRWMSEFGDPAYLAHAGAARTAGALTARLANATVIPYDYVGTAEQLLELLDEVEATVLERGWDVSLLPLRRAAEAVRASAVAFEERRDDALRANPGADPATWRPANQALLEVERRLTRPSGLVGRPWMRSLLFASDRDNGYGTMPLPAIGEAIRDGDPARAGSEVADMAARVAEAAVTLENARRALPR